MSRLRPILLPAALALLFALAGCQKDGGDAATVERPPLMLPTSQSDEDWQRYVGQLVSRNVRVRRGIPPFAVYFSPDPAKAEETQAILDNTLATLQRGVQKDTIVAFGSRDSALAAEKIGQIFRELPADRLRGARVVFVGRPEHRGVAEAAVTPSGAEFIFLEFGK